MISSARPLSVPLKTQTWKSLLTAVARLESGCSRTAMSVMSTVDLGATARRVGLEVRTGWKCQGSGKKKKKKKGANPQGRSETRPPSLGGTVNGNLALCSQAV